MLFGLGFEAWGEPEGLSPSAVNAYSTRRAARHRPGGPKQPWPKHRILILTTPIMNSPAKKIQRAQLDTFRGKRKHTVFPHEIYYR